METVLVVNAGSSSVKFQVFRIVGAAQLKLQIKGQVDGIGTRPRLRAGDAQAQPLIDASYSPQLIPDLPTALRAAATWLRDTEKLDPVAVGHRVAHGGPEFDRPVVITNEVLARLQEYACLAPLHQPNNLAPIRSLLEQRPQLPQVACFDTAFHRGHSPVVEHYALPSRFYEEGIRRYGFHGLSYEYVADRLRQLAPQKAAGRVIIAHLGSGSSMCALYNGRSVDSTMGFTALDGLPMGTRTGQLDPGVVLYLIAEKGMSPASVQDLLYKESGLKGLSGISNDVRELLISKDPRAAFAIDYFVDRACQHIGMLTASLGGLDALVFTAGIGENSATIRARIAERLDWLGVHVDPIANDAHAPVISSPESKVSVRVIPTDEELMIARHTLAMLPKHAARRRSQERIPS
jgi:acetate kinase